MFLAKLLQIYNFHSLYLNDLVNFFVLKEQFNTIDK